MLLDMYSGGVGAAPVPASGGAMMEMEGVQNGEEEVKKRATIADVVAAAENGDGGVDGGLEGDEEAINR